MNSHDIVPVFNWVVLALWISLSSWVASQTSGNLINSILNDASQNCETTPECRISRNNFLSQDLLIRMPELNLNDFDKQKISEAFALGWKAKKWKPILKDRNKSWWDDDWWWTLETINYVNQVGRYEDSSWGKESLLLRIDSYPCEKQCKETRDTARIILEYAFKMGLNK